MKSLFLGLALSLSLAAVACAPAAEETTGDEAAVTAAPTIELSDGARSVAGSILAIAPGIFRPVDEPSADILVKFARNTLTGVHVAKLPNGERKFYLDGLILIGGDVVQGSEQLVIHEKPRPFGFEAPPVYTARLSEEARPAGTTMLSRNDVRLVRAVLGAASAAAAAPSSESAKQLDLFVAQDTVLEAASIQPRPDGSSLFTLKAIILLGGDVVVGSATLTIDEKLVPAPIGFGTTSLYTVKAVIQE